MYIHTSGQLHVRDMMLAIREYLHADTQMAYHLWVLMFPIVWATLEKQQQVILLHVLCDFHNGVHVCVGGGCLCSPLCGLRWGNSSR